MLCLMGYCINGCLLLKLKPFAHSVWYFIPRTILYMAFRKICLSKMVVVDWANGGMEFAKDIDSLLDALCFGHGEYSSDVALPHLATMRLDLCFLSRTQLPFLVTCGIHSYPCLYKLLFIWVPLHWNRPALYPVQWGYSYLHQQFH